MSPILYILRGRDSATLQNFLHIFRSVYDVCIIIIQNRESYTRPTLPRHTCSAVLCMMLQMLQIFSIHYVYPRAHTWKKVPGKIIHIIHIIHTSALQIPVAACCRFSNHTQIIHKTPKIIHNHTQNHTQTFKNTDFMHFLPVEKLFLDWKNHCTFPRLLCKMTKNSKKSLKKFGNMRNEVVHLPSRL